MGSFGSPAYCLIEPVQPTGAAVQRIQPQQFSSGADVGILLSIIGKGIPFHLCIGTVIGGLGPDKESDPLLLQYPVGQGEVIGGVRFRSLKGDNVSVDMFQLFQVRDRVIRVSRRYSHTCDDATVCIYGLMREIILPPWFT